MFSLRLFVCRAAGSAGRVLVLCGIALAAHACDKSPSSPPEPTATVAQSPAAPAPTTQPQTPAAAAPAPTTAPARSQAAVPPPTFMMIDQARTDFPPARLRVSADDGRVIARLFSDDPRDAISDQYTGNSVYFEMELDAAEPKEFASAVWHFTAPSMDRSETPFGVFLDGRRRQLQPLDVKIDFEPDEGEGHTVVNVTGRFMLVHIQDENQPSRQVSVAARLIAKTTIK